MAAREAVLDRLAWQIAELRASLDKMAVANAAMAAELAASPLPLSEILNERYADPPRQHQRSARAPTDAAR
jgi:hypothetical protein